MTLAAGEGTLATSDGAEVFYRIVGEGLPAIYAHPFQNPTTRVAEIVPYRSRLSFVLPYPRGMVRSSAARTPDELSLDRLVDDMEELRTHLGVERWLVHGRSEGGFAALLYATRYPQAVSGLVLFATAPSYRYLTRQEGLYDPDHPGFRLLNETLWRFLAEPTDRNYAAHWGVRARILLRARSHAQGQTVPPALQTWPTLDQLFSSRRTEDVAAGAAARFQRFMLDVLSYDVRPDLPAVTAPALIVAGRHDPYCTLDQAEELAGLLPQSALLVLDRAAHAISADGGAAVEQAVKEFLTRHNLGA